MMNRNTLMMEEKVDSTKVNEASKNEKWFWFRWWW
jgi:hypothetical protein